MTKERAAKGVVLPAGHTGSSLFHAVLGAAAEAFPGALAEAKLPRDAATFKRSYGDALARFEAARVAAPERVQVARFVVRRTQEALCFASDAGTIPLLDHLRASNAVASTAPLLRTRFAGSPGLALEVPFEGQLLRDRQVTDLARRLHDAHQMTPAALEALDWIVEHVLQAGGKLDLRGQRFVLFGAGAELAPTRQLLRAGANVLWIDLADPARALAGEQNLSGNLLRSRGAENLLEQPREIAAAIAQFAADGPVHIGMFAYAGGASQEWRLGAAMNAITASLAPGLVRSVSLLVSPTTPTPLGPESLRAAEARLAAAPALQRAMAGVGLLRRPGHLTAHGQHVALATVALQGLSYQAAQYISKVAAAEAYAVYGTSLHDEQSRPIRVSANVAGITRTRSLSHPLFEAAFAGAHHFGVRIFDAATTRALGSLLMLHDLLRPAQPGPSPTANERAIALHRRQIHGGIYGLPFVLEGVIRAAAVAGLARHPSVLKKKPRAAELPALELSTEPYSPTRSTEDTASLEVM